MGKVHPYKLVLKIKLIEEDKELVKKAIAKLERMLKSVYGKADWDEYINEVGMDGAIKEVKGYIKESLSGEWLTENRRIHLRKWGW